MAPPTTAREPRAEPTRRPAPEVEDDEGEAAARATVLTGEVADDWVEVMVVVAGPEEDAPLLLAETDEATEPLDEAAEERIEVLKLEAEAAARAADAESEADEAAESELEAAEDADEEASVEEAAVETADEAEETDEADDADAEDAVVTTAAAAPPTVATAAHWEEDPAACWAGV